MTSADPMRRLAGACLAAYFAFSALHCRSSQDERQTESRPADVPPPGLDERSVLRNLAQYDSVYESGFAASAAERRMDRIDIHGPYFKVEARWKLTFEGDRIGFVKEVTDYETPKYLPPEQRRWAAHPTAGKAVRGEAMFATVRTKEWGYWGKEVCGNHHVDATLKVTPDGQATQAGTIYNSYLYPPRDISLIAPPRSFQWALGRFFSDRLDKVTRVEETAEGRLRVSALGNVYQGTNGTWDLEIEPAAAWMVRKAIFHPEIKPDQVFAEMANEGTVWSGPYCIPKEARINFWGPIEDMEAVRSTGTQHLTFEPAVGTFDENLYAECKQEVLHGKQPNLTVTDARMSPPAVTQPNLPEAPQVAIEAPSHTRRWVIGANLVAIIVLSTIATLRWKRKNANR